METIWKKDVYFLNKPKRIFLISAGTLFIGLAVAGIFIPVLPTTPFVLIAAALYSKSSMKFYQWLINNKIFGRHIKNYRDKKGVAVSFKVVVLIFLWIAIICSILFAINLLWVKIFLGIIALSVSIHILTLKTLTN
ncbi:MAG: YbaN family protein [Actinomycetota bacterium]|nr:YbaN family protein [Actinomycetota bacterium]